MDDGLFVLKALGLSAFYMILALIVWAAIGSLGVYILYRIAKRWYKVLRGSKGNWYYEVQCLMLVFMWQHDMTHKPIKTRGLWLGRFHIWYDTAWLDHGIAGDIRYAFSIIWCHLSLWIQVIPIRIQQAILKAKILIVDVKMLIKSLQLGIISLRNYIGLYRSGFQISHTTFHTDGKNQKDLNDLEIYRFYWKGEVIKTMPDIDRVRDHFNTVHNGHVEKLG